jgi:ribosomal-protein-alanine N-acetyltransferase
MEIERDTPQASHWSRTAYEKYVGEREKFFHRCLSVAVSGESVVGFVAGSYLEGDGAAGLESLVVDSAWRRRGVATALCVAVLNWAREQGAEGVELEVRAKNEAARALYAGMGFVETGVRRGYYSDPEDDGVLMALRLR